MIEESGRVNLQNGIEADSALGGQSSVVVENLSKTFPSPTRKGQPVVAVDGLSFTAEEGTMFTLLGPSGCGKTTTLRCIAGLEAPDTGEISIGDRTLVSASRGTSVAANERGIGMVFQSYAIWPHMNVYQNAAFPLVVLPRSRRPSRKGIHERVERVLEVVELHELMNRPATHLSGGQQQRLALARALVVEPSVLLLDEPLSNLDAKLREQMRFELKRLQRDLGITSLYVTHDQVEALTMSRHIAVINQGKVEQVGRPREIYDRPRTHFVASFIGASNLVDGVIRTREPGRVYVVSTPHGELRVTSNVAFPAATPITVAVRPENIRISTTLDDHRGWQGVVQTRAFLGDSVDHIVRIADSEIRVRSSPDVSIPPGTEVGLEFMTESCSLLGRV